MWKHTLVWLQVASEGGLSRAYSGYSDGHAADNAALQGFAKTRDAASSPARPVPDQQPTKVRFQILFLISVSA